MHLPGPVGLPAAERFCAPLFSPHSWGFAKRKHDPYYPARETGPPAVAALIVALVDAAIMAAVLLIARNVVIKQNEEKLACEMRDLAHGELNRDIEKAKADLEQVSHDVRTIRSSLVTFSGAAASTLTPLLSLLVKAVKKR